MSTTNPGTTNWLRGRVKAVPSGDCVVIMANVKADLPLEKTITLASIMAPKLVCLHRLHNINIYMLDIIFSVACMTHQAPHCSIFRSCISSS